MNPLKRISDMLGFSATKNLIAKNLFWAVLGKFVNLLSGLVVGIFVARYLGPEKYGLMNYVISLVCLFQTFALFGMNDIEIREEARKEIPYATIIGTAFTLKLISGVIFMGLVILVALLMEHDAYTITLVIIYSLSIVLNSFIVIRNFFTALVFNEYIVKTEILATCLCMVLKLVLLWCKVSLTWFLVVSMLDFLFLAVGYSISYKIKIGRICQWKFDLNYGKYLIKESFPLLLTSAAIIVYQKLDQIMIGQMINKESVGYFSVASRFVEVMMYVPLILAQTITPLLVQARKRSDKEYQDKAQKFMNSSFWLSLLFSIAVSLIAYPLIKYTFGDQYMAAVPVLQLMAFKTATVALSNTAGAMLITEGLQRYAILRDSLGCIVCVVLNFILLPRYGIIAAAFVAILSNLAAGYLADAIIPAYRHLFIAQTKALLFGWKSIVILNRKGLRS